ncbi:Metallothionein expression activator [Escovopsis weberi]|uniref:Metallothionein expression activator n=1 Tax=Escovopsis weberi TaxID=150374 RepID=A0A0M8N0X9_ESCWE|nr:Metallothionein expression activator [Escovopsis weberi]
MASIASAASIANINIEETRTETGVTLEEIAQYIQSPDTTDGKWTCLFEGCGKQFGRKENIKSHVQTHLNDRQYQCPTCQKCFVRQHDLKRHAKIHTGIKPYPCACVIDSEDNDEEMFEDMLDMGMDARSHQEMSSMSSAPMPAAAPRAANDFVPSPADDDMLIQFTGEDGLVQLERDPIMMMTKFDEEFDSTVSMFATNDDVFFA